MKTKFYTLLASAALIAQAQAGGHHGGGGVGFAAPSAASAHRAAPSFHSLPTGNFGGNRMVYSGQRFSSFSPRSQSSTAFRQHYINSNVGTPVGPRQFARGTFNRGDRLTRFSSVGNQTTTNGLRQRSGTAQVRSGNNLPANWQNHIVAQHSANWQSNWDRTRDHWWRGHHCHFINGSWFVFDFGFDPWWPYWYPSDYYAYDYYPYPYGYDQGYYDPGVYPGVYQGEEYYDQNGYADQYTDSAVAAAQERLAQQGYYRGAVDGVIGPETRRAIARYQSNEGLRVTGDLTSETLQALGLRRVASN